jgi:ArsR family transcriptional regulator, arsenate/arsenite/antimonite-responsive transcriptional repressor
MNEELIQIEHLFLAFADKTRLQLLYLLREGEMSVNELAQALDAGQPKVSRHLAYLRTLNMVTTRRAGKSIYYKLAVPVNRFAATVVDETIDWLDSFSESHGRRTRPKPDMHQTVQLPVAEPLVTYEQQSEQPDEAEPASSGPARVEEEMEVYLL